jgi:hypothetical protein
MYHQGGTAMEAVGAGGAAEHCCAMTGTLLAPEHDQQGRGLAWGRGPEVLAGGLTKMKIVEQPSRRIAGLREKWHRVQSKQKKMVVIESQMVGCANERYSLPTEGLIGLIIWQF